MSLKLVTGGFISRIAGRVFAAIAIGLMSVFAVTAARAAWPAEGGRTRGYCGEVTSPVVCAKSKPVCAILLFCDLRAL